MSREREVLYAVDRIEGSLVVLLADGGGQETLRLNQLPKGLTPGTVLSVRQTENGQPDWPSALVDREETERRRGEANQILDELRKRDPGGDVSI